jgi:hypothetical protein
MQQPRGVIAPSARRIAALLGRRARVWHLLLDHCSAKKVTRWWDCRSGSVVVAEVAAQLTRGFDLCEKLLGLDRDALDGVGAGDEAQRRLVLAGKGQQGMGELGGVAGLLSVMLFQASTVAVVPSA